MRSHLFFMEGNFKEFKERLDELDKYLKYFPVPAGRTEVGSFENDEIMEIIDQAKPLQYQQALLQNHYDPYAKSLTDYCAYLTRLDANNKGGSSSSRNHTPPIPAFAASQAPM